MYNWKNLLLLLNLPAFMPLSFLRYDSDGALMAHEDTDAPMEHWYTAIFDRAKITRTQGLLLVETYRLCEGHIGQLRTERTALFKRLSSASSACEPGAACAGPQSGGSATACGDVAAQGGICAALEGNTSAELAIIILTWLVLPTIFSPPQWARFISSCWPFPAHEGVICKIVDQALESAPQRFS